MEQWKNIMTRLENLINDVIDYYEYDAGIVMLEDMKDKIDKAIDNNENQSLRKRGLRVKNKPYDDACNMDTKTSVQQKAAQALSEINKLDGEDNLFQYILCLLKYSILPAYSIKHKDLKTKLMEHLVSHAGYELVNKEEWKDVQFLLFKTFLELQNSAESPLL